MKRCTNCKAESPDTALFCKYCGKKLAVAEPAVKFCASCGEKLDGGAFCPRCGAKAENGLDLDSPFSFGGDDPFASLDSLLDEQVRAEREKKELSLFEYTTRPDGSYAVSGYKDKYATEIKIPEGVSVICDGAFCCSRVASVSLPEGLRVIGNKAFSGCKNLENINFPSSITSVGDEAFLGCAKLNLPPPTKAKMGVDAYFGTKYYTEKNFGIIDKKVHFYYGTDNRIRIPDGVESINKCLINGFNNVHIIIPGSVKKVEGHVFSYTDRVEKVEIQRGVQLIEDNAFFECSALREVVFDGDVRIGSFAFGKCSALERVEFGDGTQFIDDFAFFECTSLKSLTLPGSLISFAGAFNSCSSLETVKIEQGVRTIGGGAFENCTALRYVTIPNGVSVIDGCAFDCCTSLREIALPEGVTEIKQGAFQHCTSLESIDLPSTVKFLGQYAFSDCGFKYFTIPESVEVIESLVFYGCKNLREVRVPRRLERYESTILNGLGNNFRVVYY